MNKLHLDNRLDELKKLVDRFKNNIDDYKSSRYDEENTKSDFIDKFFKLLGWDVNNDLGYSEDFREVVKEDKVVIKGRPKSPDYAFKIGKERQFFVEAKKPLVNIKEGIEPAFQVRRYAYSAGLPISILTDFEEFAIYDTNIKPLEADKASVARIFYCKFDEYEKYFDFLFNTFTKEAIQKGKLKKYTQDGKRKKGTQPVDKELLKQIEEWRTTLAKNIALRNKELDIYQLNEAVQKIIDRIIFLRIAEDRNTEVYNTLKTYSEQKNIYEILVKYFTNSNTKYNSGLFAIVDWLDKLIIDDKIFKEIITDLYYPNPYEFSVLPIEILGQIYEQFLGKTIRLTQGHQAKVEEKPEVRKAGGVYYTPQYIVNYIVENTVGKKIENQSPNQINTLRVLNPACGSGSFLVGAFNYLLNYHLEYYRDEKRKAKALKEGKIYLASENTYRLSIREKRKILLNNIYGVDIDPQAVEVTKLSLLLKLMEGEIVESRGELFLKSVSEALLPDLKDNIKCGNSLIGTDFYHEKNMQLFDTHEQRKINCFDWEVEFKEIMDAGGFDVVIGNPPYVSIRTKDFDISFKNYYKKIYKLAIGQYDLYALFSEKAYLIMKNFGNYGFIIPKRMLTNENFTELRKFFINQLSIKYYLDADMPFQDVSVEANVLIANKNIKHKNILCFKFINNRFEKYNTVNTEIIHKFPYNSFPFGVKQEYLSILNKMNFLKEYEFGEIVSITRGFEFGFNHKSITKEKNGYSVIKGKNINKYYISKAQYFVKANFDDRKTFKTKDLFLKIPKLVTRFVSNDLIFAIDNVGYCNTNVVYNIHLTCSIYSIKALIGILNSKLTNLWFKSNFIKDDKLFPHIQKNQLATIPLPKTEKAQHDRMVNLVEQMLEAQKETHSDKSKTETDKKLLQQRIDIIDKQIDTLVYELYGLTEEEIKIVEGE